MSINPRAKANIFSIITFFFTFNLFKKGFQKDLTEHDIYDVLPKFKTSNLGRQIESEWKKLKNLKSSFCIYRLLWRLYGKYYLFLGILKCIAEIGLVLLLPTMKGKLVSYFSSNGPNNNLTKADGFYYATVVICLSVFQCTMSHNYIFLVQELGIKIRASFCSLIYNKSLNLSNFSYSKIGIGKTVTLVSKDLISFENAITLWNNVWISVILVITASGLMFYKLGIAVLAGISVILLAIPLQIILGKLTSRLRFQAANATDQRLQLTQLFLSSVNFVKMQCLQDYFGRKIIKLRKEEMRMIKRYYFARSIFIESGTFIISLTWYILVNTYIGLGNTFTAEKAVFLKACLLALKSPVTNSIPIGILRSAELTASVKRIHQVLITPENANLGFGYTREPLINIRNLTCQIDEVTVLKDISVKLSKGLNLIYGPTASGKSLLLKIILKEVPIASGEVETKGKISYASQEPWLFPSTIRDNIIIGQEFKAERYQKVLEACGLQRDFEKFEKGDETIVEDRGRNLSRGQKVKINLARAVYLESDIYLLDDVLASLDMHLQKHVLEKCLKKFLKDKIVVLVSTNKKLLSTVDTVFILEKGAIKLNYSIQKIDDDNKSENVSSEIEKIKATYSDNVEDCNIYKEDLNKGTVGYKTYLKYFEFGGGLVIFGWICVVYIATQIALGLSEKARSKWVNLQDALSSKNSTNYENLMLENYSQLQFYALAIVLAVFFLFVRTISYFNFATNASLRLHKIMLSAISKAKIQFFDQFYIGNILNRFSKDFYHIDEDLLFNLHEFLKFICILGRIMFLIVTVNSQLLFPVGIFFLILFIMQRVYLSTGRSLQRLDSAIRSPLIGHFNATLEGLSTIRTCTKRKVTLQEKFDKLQDINNSTFYMLQSATRAFAYLLDLLSNFFTSSVIFWFLIVKKENAGDVSLAIEQAFMLRGLLQWGIRQRADLETHMTSVERVLEYSNAESEISSGTTYKFSGNITYKNVSLSYSSNQILNNINCTVAAGEKIGITGETGAGKSSFVTLLFNLFKYQGDIFIDGINIKNLSLNVLRSQMTIVPQEPVILKDTIRKNLDLKEQQLDFEIWEAINRVNLQNVIKNLDVDFASEAFSYGQKQVLCLLRSILNKTPIVILDEVTANVDEETKSVINRIIKEEYSGATVFVISHEVESLMMCDKVMVLDQGRIIEFDKREVLQEKENGLFRKLLDT